MCFYNLLHGIGQFLCLDTCRIVQKIRDVINSRYRILQALEIHSRLGVRERGFRGMWNVECGVRIVCSRSIIIPHSSLLTPRHHRLQNLILNALQGTGLRQRLGIEFYTIFLMHLHSQFDGRDRGQAGIAQNRGNAEIVIAHNGCNHLVQFLFQHIHRHVTLLHDSLLHFRLRQRTLVHLLVLVQWNSVNLHRHGRYHVRWLLVEDEVIQCLDVYLLVADDIGSNKLTGTLAFHVEGLYGGVLDARELADDGLYFFQLNAGTTNLHLSVATTYELNVA